MAKAKQHWNLYVKGIVQGVNYRASTRKKAAELGVKGFVANEADGSVYIEAEGNERQLRELAQWCQHGPSMAQVDHVEKQESEDIHGFDSFTIRH